MFTGIVEELGELVAREGTVVTVRGPRVAAGLVPGESIAVNGVCLTVTSVRPDGSFTSDVMQETFDRTTLGTLQAGQRVNLERAATLATRLGGHLVQGHVDGVGTVLSRVPGPAWETVRFALPPGLARYVVEKGSIAVDGVSLTVAAVDDSSFSVSLIPETLARTTLGEAVVGRPVNVEVDVLAKYVEKLVGAHR